ncbi:MAG: hypothetical protein AB2598_20855 [Candidatus Thiodiazotropha sp.]
MTAALAINGRFTFMDRSENTGASEASNALARFGEKLSGELSSSVTWGRSSDLTQELLEIYGDCSTSNWDGYDALPITRKAVLEAKRFISAMPIWMPTPEIVPEPNGDVGFQWSFGKDRILTVSFSGNNIVTYASILGSPERKKYGSEIFNDSIPEEVIEGVGKIRP